MSGTFSAVVAEACSCAFLSSNLFCNEPISSSMFLAFISASYWNKPTQKKKKKITQSNKTTTNPIRPHLAKTTKKSNDYWLSKSQTIIIFKANKKNKELQNHMPVLLEIL